MVLGGWAVFNERGTPVLTGTEWCVCRWMVRTIFQSFGELIADEMTSTLSVAPRTKLLTPEEACLTRTLALTHMLGFPRKPSVHGPDFI